LITKIKHIWIYTFVGMLTLAAIFIWGYSNVTAKTRASESSLFASANGVTVAVENITRNDKKGMEVTACLDLPNNADWIPEAFLVDGEKEIKSQSFDMLNWEDPKVLEGTHRCYLFAFPVGAEASSKFVVRKIRTSISELITQEECNAAFQQVQKAYDGLVISCRVDHHGIAFDYLEQPKDLDKAQLSEMITSELADTVEGPWEISFLE